MKKIIYIFLLLHFTGHTQDYIVFSNGDTLQTPIRYNNLYNSLKFVEYELTGKLFKVYPDSLSYYVRDNEMYRVGFIQNENGKQATIFKTMFVGENYSLESYMKNGEIHYKVVNALSKKELDFTESNFEKSVQKYWKKEKLSSVEKPDNKLCFDDINGLILLMEDTKEEALNKKTNKFYIKKTKQNPYEIPIYNGTRNMELKPFLVKMFEQKSETSKKTNHQKKDDDKDDSRGSGGGGKKKKSSSKPNRENSSNYSFDRQLLYFNLGVNTGLNYLNSKYFKELLPVGLGLGTNLEFAFFQRIIWFGGSYSYTLFPYLNQGNLSTRNHSVYTKISIVNHIYLFASYDWNRTNYNNYIGQDYECSNIKPESGIENGDGFYGALRLSQSISNGFSFGIGLNTHGSFLSIFNDFSIVYSRIQHNPSINNYNLTLIESEKNIDFTNFNHQMHLISLKIGIHSWWED